MALSAIRDDLARRPGGRAVLPDAERILRFYVRTFERGDVLVTSPPAIERMTHEPPPETKPKPEPSAETKPKRRRKRRLKPVSGDFALLILRAADRPLSATEIQGRLAEDYDKALSRQEMSYMLLRLEEDGEIVREPATEGTARHLWRLDSRKA
jgi:hypothetical protein